jgi:NodT family efflux transporter outer membrane factor (OMF) lipoprotein
LPAAKQREFRLVKHIPTRTAAQRRRHKLPSRFALSFVLASLAGCAVGPDFVSPTPPVVDRYTPERLAGVGGQRLVIAGDIPQRWWEVFHNRNLNRLIEAAIEHNPSLESAEAAVRIAYYGAEAQKGAFLPSLGANSNDTYQYQSGQQKFQGAGPTNPFAIYLKQLSVSYTPDVWGENRRAVESLEAQTDVQRYQLEAAYLSLTSNVAAAAIQEASLRGQIAATREVIRIEQELVGLLRKQYAVGSVAMADVVTQEAALAQVMQLLPPLEKSLAQQRDLLTALAGQYSTAEVPETFNLKAVAMPRDLPITLPSTFVRQRPDVRAAEANVHSVTAQIGVAIAARLPNVTLSASAGYSAFSFAQLFTPLIAPPLTAGSSFWVGASNIVAPVFDGFTLINRQKAAEVALTQAEAQYRQAVITAFQNVADALRALQADDKAVKAAVYAEQTAKKSLEIVKKQFLMREGGAVNILAVLNAEQTYLLAAVSRVQAEGNRLSDVVGLFMALGGGWKDQNLKNLPPHGPQGPTSEQIARINGPVNPSWFPSFLDRESADDREQGPKAPLPPPVVPLRPSGEPSPSPPIAQPSVEPMKPPANSGWLPNFLD